MPEKGMFKCLRCNHMYEDTYLPNVPQERSCPKCGSNSVRRIEQKTSSKQAAKT